MTDATTIRPVAVACYLTAALIWGILAQLALSSLRTRRPQSQLFRLLPVLTGLTAMNYVLSAVFFLLPADMHLHPPRPLLFLYLVSNVAIVAGVAVGRHLLCFIPRVEEPPGRSWLAANYGSALLVATLAVFPRLIPAATPEDSVRYFLIVRNAYVLIMIGLMLRQVARFARRGTWRRGGLLEFRQADVVILACGLVGAAGWLAFSVASRWAWNFPLIAFYDVAVALALAMPLVVRALGEVVRRFLLTASLAAAAGTVYAGARALTSIDPALRALVDVGAVGALLLVLVPGQQWIRGVIDRRVFQRSRQRREELQAFLHTLSPELGPLECCRRALAEVTRVTKLRGAAILLADGSSIVHGAFALEPLERVWPRGVAADGLPARVLLGFELRELPAVLGEALIDAEVAGVVPIASPRRRWGHLLIATGFLVVAFDEDAPVLEAFADQLALVLDGAELLARAVAVERSLAHAEKLTAIGELAARIAHEIRNPVTAARSLAQQLAREPGSPFAAEHAVILTELDRVERQVADLLRFARRDELHCDTVDLGQLVRGTVEQFRPRLEAAGIGIELTTRDGITARVDREKMRQVLVNLIENAMDALAATPRARRLGVEVAAVNGSATFRVSDNGPGVPADTLPHLFEPFFSLKASGTGLGLAIVRRTVEAHGGQIAATARATGSGMIFEVELPLAGPEPGRPRS